MRFHPRFDVGEDGERLREKVLRAPTDVIEFVRKYMDEVEKVTVQRSRFRVQGFRSV